MDASITKHCNGCGFDLPGEQFRKCKQTRDGLRTKCKGCEQAYDKARSESRKEYRREHRDWDRHTEITRRWRDKNKEKRRAHDAVRYALKKGTLVRQPCERCGSTHRVEAHHDDYSKPLDVKWLCEEHHKQRHVELRLEANKYQETYLRWDVPKQHSGVTQDENDSVVPF